MVFPLNKMHKPISLEILQVNIGPLCNKTCTHCHLKAGPERTESMNRKTMIKLQALADRLEPRIIDITGGAPEMNPLLRWFVSELVNKGHSIQLRSNLTALLLDESLIDFLSSKKVKLVASLPCYIADEVDSVRGSYTFTESIKALQLLNAKGYCVEKGLELDLVYNPEADFLPPPQIELEKTYRRRLKNDHEVEFSHLISITNMPIGRFRDLLIKNGRLDSYMKLLRENYNPDTQDALMCRHQLEVNWEGELYDCDFNLALDLPMRLKHNNIHDPQFDISQLIKREIVYDEHCFGCAAGQGSSCSGALTF